MAITICNLRNRKPRNPWDVKIDRSSPLGNIFCMAGEAQRNTVCDQYDNWFRQTVLESKQVSSWNELRRLKALYKEYGKLNLFCWCAPKKCHGETIKQWLENNK